MGPSLGWTTVQIASVYPVTAGGTTNVPKGTTLVLVSFNGAVSLQLPDMVPTNIVPESYFKYPLTIVDAGGFAGAGTEITILPAAGKTIMGLASIQISNPHGSFSLLPKPDGNWEQQ